MEVTIYKVKLPLGLTMEESLHLSLVPENRELIGIFEHPEEQKYKSITIARSCGGCGGGKVR